MSENAKTDDIIESMYLCLESGTKRLLLLRLTGSRGTKSMFSACLISRSSFAFTQLSEKGDSAIVEFLGG